MKVKINFSSSQFECNEDKQKNGEKLGDYILGEYYDPINDTTHKVTLKSFIDTLCTDYDLAVSVCDNDSNKIRKEERKDNKYKKAFKMALWSRISVVYGQYDGEDRRKNLIGNFIATFNYGYIIESGKKKDYFKDRVTSFYELRLKDMIEWACTNPVEYMFGLKMATHNMAQIEKKENELLQGTATIPQTSNNVVLPTTPTKTEEKDNTLLYIGLGAAALVAIVLLVK